MVRNFHKIYGKNGPRISICIIKTRTCRADLQVESTKTKVFFSVFDLARRRCVADDLHRDWFLFPSRAPQQWGLLESWHNTSEQRLRTVGFCTGSGDHGGMEMFFSSRESEVPAIAEVSLSPRVFFDENKWKPFHATVLRLAGAYWNSAWLVTWTRSAEKWILCWVDSPIVVMTSNKWKCD